VVVQNVEEQETYLLQSSKADDAGDDETDSRTTSTTPNDSQTGIEIKVDQPEETKN
jgi:hypothetical protein